MGFVFSLSYFPVIMGSSNQGLQKFEWVLVLSGSCLSLLEQGGHFRTPIPGGLLRGKDGLLPRMTSIIPTSSPYNR